MRRWLIGAALVAALVAGATGLAASPGTQADALGRLFLGPRTARAEIILVTGGVAHDWRLDQGRVAAVRPTAVELVEKDGTRVVVPVAGPAQVSLNGQPATLLDVTRGMTVLTARDGGAPATIVRARSRRGPVQGGLLGRLFLGAGMARAEILLFQLGVAHDWFLDQGHVTAVRPSTIELVEKDGRRVVVPLAATAQVLLNGRPATSLDVTRGMRVLTARDGTGPASLVRAWGKKAAKGPK